MANGKAKGDIKIRKGEINKLVRQVVNKVLVPAAEDIADKCNSEAGIKDGYRAGTEGSTDMRLQKRSYRATVITATGEAIRDNDAHNRLINNLEM